jgi:hypothetical protein
MRRVETTMTEKYRPTDAMVGDAIALDPDSVSHGYRLSESKPTKPAAPPPPPPPAGAGGGSKRNEKSGDSGG